MNVKIVLVCSFNDKQRTLRIELIRNSMPEMFDCLVEKMLRDLQINFLWDLIFSQTELGLVQTIKNKIWIFMRWIEQKMEKNCVVNIPRVDFVSLTLSVQVVFRTQPKAQGRTPSVILERKLTYHMLTTILQSLVQFRFDLVAFSLTCRKHGQLIRTTTQNGVSSPVKFNICFQYGLMKYS